MADLTAVARSYFDKVRIQDATAIAAMFAPDGVITLPDGRRFVGGEAISAFYRKHFATMAPTPEVLSTITEGRRCLVELTARLADGSASFAADVFEFDAGGLIAGLTIYGRATG